MVESFMSGSTNPMPSDAGKEWRVIKQVGVRRMKGCRTVAIFCGYCAIYDPLTMESFVRNTPGVSTEQARVFLEKRVRTEIFGNLMGGLFSLIAGAFCVLIVVWLAWFITQSYSGRNPHAWLWVTLGVSVFSSVGYATTDSEYLSKLEIRTVDGRPAYDIPLPGGWRLSNVNRLSPTTLSSQAKVVLQLLFALPRSFVGAWRYGRHAFAIMQMNPAASAGIFAVLVTRGRRIPYEELAGHALKEPEKAFSDLLLLDVAQHLETQPQGLVISSKCREAMTGIKRDAMDF
jgi:hypothetical protein